MIGFVADLSHYNKYLHMCYSHSICFCLQTMMSKRHINKLLPNYDTPM